jgi:hypothetical protein
VLKGSLNEGIDTIGKAESIRCGLTLALDTRVAENLAEWYAGNAVYGDAANILYTNYCFSANHTRCSRHSPSGKHKTGHMDQSGIKVQSVAIRPHCTVPTDPASVSLRNLRVFRVKLFPLLSTIFLLSFCRNRTWYLLPGSGRNTPIWIGRQNRLHSSIST